MRTPWGHLLISTVWCPGRRTEHKHSAFDLSKRQLAESSSLGTLCWACKFVQQYRARILPHTQTPVWLLTLTHLTVCLSLPAGRIWVASGNMHVLPLEAVSSCLGYGWGATFSQTEAYLNIITSPSFHSYIPNTELCPFHPPTLYCSGETDSPFNRD